MINLIDRFLTKFKVHKSSIKINKMQSKNIYDILRPIYILSITFGLRVFEFPRNYSRPILSFIYSISIFLLYYFSWSYRKDLMKKSNINHFEGFVGYVVSVVDHFVVITILLMGLYNSKSSKLCAKRINEIDKTLKELGSLSSFNNIYKITMKEIIIVFVYTFFTYIIVGVGMVTTNTVDGISISFVIFLCLFQYFYSFVVEFLTLIEFVTIVRCIKSEFRRGNELLSDLDILTVSSVASEIIDRKETTGYGCLVIESSRSSLPLNSEKLFTLIPSSRQTQSRLQVANYKMHRCRILLRTIRQVHLELYKVSKCFSEIYGIQISLEMVICVFCNTHVLFDFYGKYMEDMANTISLKFQFVLMILCLIQFSTRIFIVNYICDRTMKEAKRTNEIIHTFYGKNTDVEIRKEIEIFSMQMMQFNNAYSAFGLYNFDCKQICSCIGIITTYLVILIQVADSLRKGS